MNSTCQYHPDIEASTNCQKCKSPICEIDLQTEDQTLIIYDNGYFGQKIPPKDICIPCYQAQNTPSFNPILLLSTILGLSVALVPFFQFGGDGFLYYFWILMSSIILFPVIIMFSLKLTIYNSKKKYKTTLIYGSGS